MKVYFSGIVCLIAGLSGLLLLGFSIVNFNIFGILCGAFFAYFGFKMFHACFFGDKEDKKATNVEQIKKQENIQKVVHQNTTNEMNEEKNVYYKVNKRCK